MGGNSLGAKGKLFGDVLASAAAHQKAGDGKFAWGELVERRRIAVDRGHGEVAGDVGAEVALAA